MNAIYPPKSSPCTPFFIVMEQTVQYTAYCRIQFFANSDFAESVLPWLICVLETINVCKSVPAGVNSTAASKGKVTELLRIQL
jgi:hypothetical protein